MIVDLADAMIASLSPKARINVVEIGVRPGEKINEALMTEEEARVAIDHGDLYIIKAEWDLPQLVTEVQVTNAVSPENFKSEMSKHLTKEEICQLLEKIL